MAYFQEQVRSKKTMLSIIILDLNKHIPQPTWSFKQANLWVTFGTKCSMSHKTTNLRMKATNYDKTEDGA